MSSNYSCSPKDDFFDALNKSLRKEYSSQKMSNFMSDLLIAINHLDDDPNDGFGFYDEETSCWNGLDYFTSASSNDYSESLRQDFRAANLNDIRDVSVDMFADQQSQNLLDKTYVVSDGKADSTIVDSNVRNTEPNPQSVPVADIAVILEEESCDSSVDMFAEFESDEEVIDTDSVGSDEINTTKQSSVADCHQSKEIEDSECVTQMNRSINGQHSVASYKNQFETINEINGNGRHLKVNQHPGAEIITKRKLPQHIESSNGWKDENPESEAVGSVDILLGVPLNISYYEGNDDGNNELLPPQICSPISQRSFGVVTGFSGIFSDTENLLQENDRRIHSFVEEGPNTSIPSSCQSSPFRGFSPVPPLLQQSICASTNCDNQVALMSQTSQYDDQTSQHRSSVHNSPRSVGDGLNSTFCEEYESERLLIAYLNATQGDHINLEEAYTQCFSESRNQLSGTVDRRQSLIEEIEKLVLKIQSDLVNGCKLAIVVPYKVSWSNCFVNDERLCLRPLTNGGTRTINSKRRIAMIVYVLSFVYKLLVNNETCTRREIYYSDPDFIHSQIQLDTAIMDICFILNTPPWQIGILSSSKGLIAGSIKLTLKDDTVIDVNAVDGGILLPQQTMSIKKVETAARFVLLVEKHTVYEKLLVEDVLNRLSPCILITGKGYPDINTRAILKKISDDCKCPIYALVDADPYGIDIMLSYRHGSMNMSFFNDNLAIPSIRWIGVLPSEMKKFKLQSMPMTQRDANRVDNLMKRPYLSKKIYEELLVLKKSQKKSEVEALLASTTVGSIHTHLLRKIQNGEVI